MEIELRMVESQSPKTKQPHQNTLSCSQSNPKTNKQSLSKQNKVTRQCPFTIMKNYRTKHRNLEKREKNSKKILEKTKRRMSVSQEPELSPEMFRLRKMTETIQIEECISEEEPREESVKSKDLEIEHQKQNDSFEGREKQEIWQNPQLQKMIPMEIRQYALDIQSPLELTALKNIGYNDPIE